MLIVAGWALYRGVRMRPAREEWGPLAVLSLLFTAQIGLLNSATEMTSPAFGVVILNSYAVFANLTGHFFPGMERPLNGELWLAGLGLSIAGMSVLCFGQGASTLAPRPVLGKCADGGVLGAAGDPTGIYPLAGPTDRADADDCVADGRVGAAVPRGGGGEPAFGVRRWGDAAGGRGDPVSGVVVAGICFIVWAELLKRHAAGTLSMFAFLVPISGIGAERVVLRGTAGGRRCWWGWSAGAARSVGGDAGLNGRRRSRRGPSWAITSPMRSSSAEKRKGFARKARRGPRWARMAGSLRRLAPRHVNDRGLRAIDGELHRKLEAGAVGHLHVRDNQVDVRRPRRAQMRRAAARLWAWST